ncbi:MAG: DegT/DnrJ/EryC1/StrS family aminotransferase [Candidatus Heimdallarchaeota archaeon]|nr:DegT/DnrJ/EryC1/StrS family aminotransferase [Candidatus Heimdallarchaeota archaeon]
MDEFIPVSKPSITDLELNYVTKAVKSGWVSSLGSFLTEFEEKFAKYNDVKYAALVSNGTVGLHLALKGYGISSLDEVIIPNFTFIATANAVSYVGAKISLADIDPNSLCLDTDNIKNYITDKTRAIIPVHIYGHPANMNIINEIASENNLIVIEDCAEAHGAAIGGTKVGSFGNCGVFSFYGNKIITTGEGGIITTNDHEFYESIISLRDHAMDKNKRYWHDKIGFNYRMTNLQAALGLAQLERIEEILNRKLEIFIKYKELLGEIHYLKLNQTKIGYKNVYWVIYIIVDNLNLDKRDKLMDNLKRLNIDTRPFFYPISQMMLHDVSHDYKTPVTNQIYSKGIILPSFYDLTDDQITYICSNLLVQINLVIK